jgi:PAS domain S-box-containing protein
LRYAPGRSSREVLLSGFETGGGIVLGFTRVLIASVVLALVLGAVAAVFAYTHASGLAQSRFLVGHTHEVIEEAQHLFSLIEDAETGERGYLLTHESAYLAPYESALNALPAAERRLASMVADNPGQAEHVAKLKTAIDTRLAFLGERVAQARGGDFAGAVALIRDGRGPVAMARVRELRDIVISTERVLLARRVEAAANAERQTLVLGLVVAGLALVGLMSLIVFLGRTTRRLERSLIETRDARAALEASNALVTGVFANTTDYLMVLDVRPDGRFVLAEINPAMAKALRVSIDRVRGRSIDELLPAQFSAQLIDFYRRVRDSDRPVVTRNQFRLPEGQRTWESILAPVRNASGATDRIIGSIRDITERVQAEARLRGAQRMEAVGQLTGGVAHDFNNLLQVIRGNLDLLEPLLGGSEPGQRRLKNALHGVDRAAQLTRQLLAFARRQPLDPEVVNLSRLVGDMSELLRRTLGEDVEIETIVAGGLWNTMADPAQVESAVLNLALNSRDAMPQGGRLTVEISNATLDAAYVRDIEGLEAGQYVLIAVSDTGQGMDEEVRARVFEPFFSTKPEGKGTGLGLSMVYGFVRQSRGHVQVYSEPGHGTTVKIYLPRAHAEETLREEAPAAVGSDGQQTVLVVEDEPGVRAVAVGMLEELGYACIEAGDAAQALALLRETPGIDVIFSDVVMPGPLKTRDFAAQVAAEFPAVRILFTSGYTDNAIVHHGRLDPGVSLLSKPYGKADLSRKLAQVLATKGESEGSAM